MGLMSKLQNKIELYRLEQKYTRRKNRSTFTTGAQYVDGEYVYQPDGQLSASSTGSTGSTNKRRSMWMSPRN
ncbi:uncharacterized protein HMPREF1541_02005 [Cyphellophora europaea CBS 101466]|uniref:Uncharacterized protein n=1 Tax=Cyphellophora europaea (strain CBS 101466) TaxID=1220924 RepID=W2S2E5_CYPE1|nr:uncharacterized protein HMPREF1541_02005 [Cyphellophora europaea CBS 101466]ETN42847.1 hypothetical protein HMPREF1541_02005 [Cyphellophora europaea CBS 101466]